MERKDFLKRAFALGGLAIIPAGLLTGCSKQNSSAPVNVDFTLDLTQPTNAVLKDVNGYLVINGVIIIRSSTSTFNVYSAACTHAGCTVYYDPATTNIICPCHTGTFSSVTGGVLTGLPPTPLTRYTATLNGPNLTVKS
jgi:Rieske Fe-S protein